MYTPPTDNTVDVIRDYMYLHSIPGSVISKPWKFFAKSRNDSIEHALTCIKKKYKIPASGPITNKEFNRINNDNWNLIADKIQSLSDTYAAVTHTHVNSAVLALITAQGSGIIISAAESVSGI